MRIVANGESRRAIAFLFSCILYGAAALQVGAGGFPSEIPYLYVRSFWVLLAVSVVLSAILLFIKGLWTTLSTMLGRICVTLFIGYPLQEYIGVEVTLSAGLLIEIFAAFYGFRAVLTAVAFVALTLLMQRPVRFLGDVMTSGPRVGMVARDDILSFGIYLLTLLIILIGFRWVFDRFTHQKNALKQLQRSVKQLVDANLSFQDYAILAEKTGKDSERDRITREIHDSSGYVYTNLIALLEVAISMGRSDPEKLSDVLFEARDQAREGLAETRKSLRKLRQTSDQEPYGTIRLYRLIQAFRRTVGIGVHTEFGNSRMTYGDSVDRAVYRLVQEALTNAIRHGHATEIWIYLWETSDHLKVYISDNGVGAASIEKGLGITGMEERIRAVGGTVNLPRRTDGFHIVAEIPMESGGVYDETYQSADS